MVSIQNAKLLILYIMYSYYGTLSFKCKLLNNKITVCIRNLTQLSHDTSDYETHNMVGLTYCTPWQLVRHWWEWSSQVLYRSARGWLGAAYRSCMTSQVLVLARQSSLVQTSQGTGSQKDQLSSRNTCQCLLPECVVYLKQQTMIKSKIWKLPLKSNFFFFYGGIMSLHHEICYDTILILTFW